MAEQLQHHLGGEFSFGHARPEGLQRGFQGLLGNFHRRLHGGEFGFVLRCPQGSQHRRRRGESCPGRGRFQETQFQHPQVLGFHANAGTGKPQRRNGLAEGFPPLSGVVIVEERQDVVPLSHLGGFQRGEDEGLPPIGGEESDHRALHEVEMQAGEVGEGRAGVEGEGIETGILQRLLKAYSAGVHGCLQRVRCSHYSP